MRSSEDYTCCLGPQLFPGFDKHQCQKLVKPIDSTIGGITEPVSDKPPRYSQSWAHIQEWVLSSPLLSRAPAWPGVHDN